MVRARNRSCDPGRVLVSSGRDEAAASGFFASAGMSSLSWLLGEPKAGQPRYGDSPSHPLQNHSPIPPMQVISQIFLRLPLSKSSLSPELTPERCFTHSRPPRLPQDLPFSPSACCLGLHLSDTPKPSPVLPVPQTHLAPPSTLLKLPTPRSLTSHPRTGPPQLLQLPPRPPRSCLPHQPPVDTSPPCYCLPCPRPHLICLRTSPTAPSELPTHQNTPTAPELLPQPPSVLSDNPAAPEWFPMPPSTISDHPAAPKTPPQPPPLPPHSCLPPRTPQLPQNCPFNAL